MDALQRAVAKVERLSEEEYEQAEWDGLVNSPESLK